MGPKQLRRIPHWAGLSPCRRSISGLESEFWDFFAGSLVWFPLVLMFEICWFHRRCDFIVTPRCFTDSTSFQYFTVKGVFMVQWIPFAEHTHDLAFVYTELLSQFSSSCRSFCREFVSLCNSTARYKIVGRHLQKNELYIIMSIWWFVGKSCSAMSECARLCWVSRVLRFLPVSPMWVAWQSQHLILYASPSLSSGFSLSLTLVSGRRKLVLGFLYNTKIESAFDVQ